MAFCHNFSAVSVVFKPLDQSLAKIGVTVIRLDHTVRDGINRHRSLGIIPRHLARHPHQGTQSLPSPGWYHPHQGRRSGGGGGGTGMGSRRSCKWCESVPVLAGAGGFCAEGCHPPVPPPACRPCTEMAQQGAEPKWTCWGCEDRWD